MTSKPNIHAKPTAPAVTVPITIGTNVLASVVKWACTDVTRSHICTVLFERGHAIATDGHRMVLLPIETNDQRLLVDARHLSAAVAAQRDMHVDRPHAITLSRDDAHVVLGIGNGAKLVVPYRAPEQYPPYEQVIPKHDPAAPAPHGYILDPRFLAAIAEVNAAVAPNAQRGVKVVAWSPTDADGQMLGAMLFEGYEGVRFVVMPMRCV